jgi:putative addiction module CopG family antidote
MSTIPIQLPAELQQFVETKVTQGQFATASEYIVALVDAAKKRRSDIEAALVEGLESGPAQEWTSQEWQDIKERIIKRHQER